MDIKAAPVSLTQSVAPLDAGEHVVKAGFLGSEPALALADGRVLTGASEGRREVALHGGAGLLTAVFAGDRLVTGGDDGRVMALSAKGEATEIARDEKRGWIDGLAATPAGAVAWSVGKRVTARDEKGRLKTFEARSTPQGLAFAPKGYRLAVPHYDGVSLWYPNLVSPPDFLEWKGSHLDAIFSPDGRFVVTSMQENALHGWRLAQKPGEKPAHMRMSGYPSRRAASPGRMMGSGSPPAARKPSSSGPSKAMGPWARRRGNAG